MARLSVWAIRAQAWEQGGAGRDHEGGEDSEDSYDSELAFREEVQKAFDTLAGYVERLEIVDPWSSNLGAFRELRDVWNIEGMETYWS